MKLKLNVLVMHYCDRPVSFSLVFISFVIDHILSIIVALCRQDFFRLKDVRMKDFGHNRFLKRFSSITGLLID